MKLNLGRDFWIYRIGQFVSALGDGCLNVGFMWWVLDVTNSAAAASFIMFPSMFTRVFLMPLFGPVGDRFKRKYIVAISDLWRGILIATLGILALNGMFKKDILVVIFVLAAVGTALYNCVYFSIVPQLVSKENLDEAIRQTNAVQSFSNIAGFLFGGFFVSLFGYKWAFIFDGITFFMAGLLSLSIKPDTSPSFDSTKDKKFGFSLWFDDLKSGIKFISSIKVLLYTSILSSILTFFFASFNFAFPLLAKNILKMPAWFFSMLMVSVSVGSIIGSLSSKHFLKYYIDKEIIGSHIIIGFLIFIFCVFKNPYFSLTTLFLIGFVSGVVSTLLSVNINTAVPEKYRSRYYSLSGFINSITAPIGVAIFGPLFDKLGFTLVMEICAVSCIIVGLGYIYVSDFVRFCRASKQDLSTFFIKTYPKAFD
ncbi:MAG: MFS transporter [Elusimicrobiales bacterium]|nr:MFS transporter [Elusimicrobiales bacterium]